MRWTPPKLPAKAQPVAACTRTYDGAELEWFVLPRTYRSHDRMVNGTRYWIVAIAIGRSVVHVDDRRHGSEQAAVEAARVSCESIP